MKIKKIKVGYAEQRKINIGDYEQVSELLSVDVEMDTDNVPATRLVLSESRSVTIDENTSIEKVSALLKHQVKKILDKSEATIRIQTGKSTDFDTHQKIITRKLLDVEKFKIARRKYLKELEKTMPKEEIDENGEIEV